MINNILYSFSIEPILTNGIPGKDGHFIELADGQRISGIDFSIIDTQQVMKLTNNGTPVTGYDQIKFLSFNITNNVFNPIGTSSFTCVIDSIEGYNFNNLIVDIIREGDIFRAYYQSLYDTSPTQLMVGQIENVNVNYTVNGCVITFTVGYLLNILARSQLVQTKSQSEATGTILTTFSPQQVVFGDFLHELLSETSISQTTGKTIYYGGKHEKIASGKADSSAPLGTSGSAINAQSYVYTVTPPTDTKLSVLLQILYPYQRVMYIDTNGNLLITPLSLFFDNTENWSFGINGESKLVPLSSINVTKNTTTLQNRSYCSMNQYFQQFNVSDNLSGNAAAAVSVAVPNADLFPRAYDFVSSGLGLQTNFVIQAFDANAFMQNSGLLNTAYNFSTLEGVKSVLKVDNQNIGISTNTPQDPLKFAMSLYAGRTLAESLVNDLLVDITFPTINSYSEELSRFRKFPLNQMITPPPVKNKMYDEQQQLFCYGFNLNFNASTGSTTTLNLCKPYVFTAFWVENLVEI